MQNIHDIIKLCSLCKQSCVFFTCQNGVCCDVRNLLGVINPQHHLQRALNLKRWSFWDDAPPSFKIFPENISDTYKRKHKTEKMFVCLFVTMVLLFNMIYQFMIQFSIKYSILKKKKHEKFPSVSLFGIMKNVKG